MIKIVLLLVENDFFSLNEGIREKACQVVQKHTAAMQSFYLKNIFAVNSYLKI